MNLYLIRHSETEWNLTKRLQGWGDAPLTEKGVRQAEALAAAIADIPFDRFYCSSSNRARRTLEIAMTGRDYVAEYADDIREIGLGEWEGRSQEEIELKEPENFHAFWETPKRFCPRGGENYSDVIARTSRKINEIIKQGGENVLVMSHTIAIRCIVLSLLNEDISMLWDRDYLQPTGITLFAVTGGVPLLKYFGDSAHLNGI